MNSISISHESLMNNGSELHLVDDEGARSLRLRLLGGGRGFKIGVRDPI